jgi:hypothetical protein
VAAVSFSKNQLKSERRDIMTSSIILALMGGFLVGFCAAGLFASHTVQRQKDIIEQLRRSRPAPSPETNPSLFEKYRRLKSAVRELRSWGVEWDDERMKHLTVQLRRDEVEEAEKVKLYITHGEDGYWLHLDGGGKSGAIHIETRAFIVGELIERAAVESAEREGEK